MTVSTLGQQMAMASYVGRVQTQLADNQLRMASGKVSETYSGLGASAGMSISMNNRIAQMEQYRATISVVDARAEYMDVSMRRVFDTATDVRTEIMASTSEGYDLTLLRRRADDAIQEVVGALNGSLNGRYLFAGHRIDNAPMADSTTVKGLVAAAIVPGDPATTITNIDAVFATSTNFYQGDNGAVSARIDVNTQVSYGVTGDDPAFNDIAKGLYVLAVLDPTTTPPAEYDQLRDWAMASISQGEYGVNNLVAQNGLTRNTLESVDDTHAAVTVTMKSYVSNIEDADMYETINRVTMLQTQLQSSFMMTARLSEMSLANYL